jgi:hypothetical protein
MLSETIFSGFHCIIDQIWENMSLNAVLNAVLNATKCCHLPSHGLSLQNANCVSVDTL